MKALLAAFVSLAFPLLAQTPAQLKQELKSKEVAAKKDPDALYEAGKWAKTKGLAEDAKRIFNTVLKLKPDHAGANEGLGNAQFEGKWLPAKEAESLRKKADAAAYAAKGMVEVGGVWVEKDQVEDAKAGVFHHENELVTKEEKIALTHGKVRHPDTDEIIDQKDLEQAKNHKYKIGGDNRWVDEKEADKYHSDINRPWMIRSVHCTLVSTYPLARLTELRVEADRGYVAAMRVLGDAPLPPANRPVVIIAATEDEYREYGKAFGDATSTWGAFGMRDEVQVNVPYLGPGRGGVCDGTGQLGPYNIRDAVGIAFAEARAAAAGANLPLWLRHAAGTYASRFESRSVASFYAKQHLARGGVKELKGFFSSFDLNGEMSAEDLRHNTFQAGLVLDFAVDGGDADVNGAWKAMVDALVARKGDAANKAIEKFTAAAAAAHAKVQAHLQKLVSAN